MAEPTVAPAVREQAMDEAASPVRDIGDADGRRVQPGIALCLSGGGYRAMLFHLGSLWRLNELGFLPRLDRVSSVSGGSITAGALGTRLATPRLRRARRRPCLRHRGGRPAAPPGRSHDRHPDRPPRRASPGNDRRPARRRLRAPPVRRRDAPGPPRPPALRLQRDEPPVRRPLAVLEAVHGRLPRRDDRAPHRAPGARRRGVVGVPARPLPRQAEARPGLLRRRPGDAHGARSTVAGRC